LHYEFDPHGALLRTSLPLPRRAGKVRDVYELDADRLLIVSTDRISAFDWVLPSGIPGKGEILTRLSGFWLQLLDVPHHMLSLDVEQAGVPGSIDLDPLRGRSMVVRRAEVVPFECVARGYLEGSGWRDYLDTGRVGGNSLPRGLVQCDRLPAPIFTPATKALSGHDENVSFADLEGALGTELAERLRAATLHVYQRASEHAAKRGVLIADTKLEWGFAERELLLVDEVLTPDSSRFWPEAQYRAGGPQPSFDKQFVREYLMSTDWDRNSPPPPLPREVVERTAAKYNEALERLTGPAAA
jgi:phosphoribosylaminoimidazole-succinocarboxamide synthase